MFIQTVKILQRAVKLTHRLGTKYNGMMYDRMLNRAAAVRDKRAHKIELAQYAELRTIERANAIKERAAAEKVAATASAYASAGRVLNSTRAKADRLNTQLIILDELVQ